MQEAHLAVLLAIVGTHRRHHDPVLDSHAAYSKGFKYVFEFFFHINNIS